MKEFGERCPSFGKTYFKTRPVFRENRCPLTCYHSKKLNFGVMTFKPMSSTPTPNQILAYSSAKSLHVWNKSVGSGDTVQKRKCPINANASASTVTDTNKIHSNNMCPSCPLRGQNECCKNFCQYI